MDKTLIVCEKPYFRRKIEQYCSQVLPKETTLHFDTIAFVTALDSKYIGPIEKIGDEYRVGTVGDGVPFQTLTLSNVGVDTNNYIIDQTNRSKRDLSVDYNAVLFACEPDTKGVLSAYEYCERHNISTNKAYFVGIPCTLDYYMKNIVDQSKWVSLTAPEALGLNVR